MVETSRGEKNCEQCQSSLKVSAVYEKYMSLKLGILKTTWSQCAACSTGGTSERESESENPI